MASEEVCAGELSKFDIDFNSELEEYPRRFLSVTDSDVEKLINEEENENTKKKTFYDINIVKKFLVGERNETRDIAEISPPELNNYLSQFVVAARTKVGKEYEPSSLRGILSSIERYLSRVSYGKSIFKDSEFKKTRDALKAKQKELKRHGRGNKPNATSALTDEEVGILFEKKLLGISSPQALQNTVWLNNMIHFGLRGCKEQKQLRWGDIVLKTTFDGKEYLEYSERQTKTRTGEDPRNQRAIKPRMYANETTTSAERDPVHVYKVYKEKRPPTMLEADATFYLSVNYFKTDTALKDKDANWYKAQPMGINKLNGIMKEMTQAAGIPAKTNHSGRKTLVQKLQDSGVPPNQIIQITGHKNLQSINNYSSLREKQIENISHILSSTISTTTAAADINATTTSPSPVHCQFPLSSSTSSSVDLNSFNENKLQTMFHGNFITGGVFNINLANTKNKIESPDCGSKRKYRRLVFESDSSQESAS